MSLDPIIPRSGMSNILHYKFEHGIFFPLTPAPSYSPTNISSEYDFISESNYNSDLDLRFDPDNMQRQHPYAISEVEPDFSHLPGPEQIPSPLFVVENEEIQARMRRVEENELDVWRRGVQGGSRAGSENGTVALNQARTMSLQYQQSTAWLQPAILAILAILAIPHALLIRPRTLNLSHSGPSITACFALKADLALPTT
ncbi:hypothetical protein VTL71DRAFT_2030 [Oculimacula yallundae]|uniref:Uncharacterized protein n=1 Tax=Oculimacula yallundae TaxID=86028 RepID=A0ABR4CCE5_9HELO